MTQNKNKIFKIIITQEYKLKLSLIDQEEKETVLQSDFTPLISFDNNHISFQQENQNAIDFMTKWIENPEEYSCYTIHFHNKQFDLLPEVLFALIINEYKKKIEREFIIENTIIEIPINNSRILQRIKISLQANNFKGIEIAYEEEIPYEYSQQGEYLEEIIEKKEENDK